MKNVEARFEVSPACLVSNYGLKPKDIKLAEAIIEDNKELLVAKWNEYHGKQN